MATTTNKYSAEVGERAVRLVQQARGDHPSEWATICSIASKIGCTAERLRKWVPRTEADARRGDQAHCSTPVPAEPHGAVSGRCRELVA